nr:unnamed protein product [Callosobruchus analis]
MVQQQTQVELQDSVQPYDTHHDITHRINPPCQNSPETVLDCDEALLLTHFDDDLYLQIENEDDSEDEHDNTEHNLIVDLRHYIVQYSVLHNHANKLLEIIRANRINGLPKDVRTLIGTPKAVEIQQLGSGEFWYYGIENSLRRVEYPEGINQLKLNFHIDGLPVGKSTKKQFWPILMNVAYVSELLKKCFVVAIYSGNSKPDTGELYRNQFIKELLKLLETGIENMEGKRLSIKINAFICDTPACAFIKCIVSHNAYYSCTKCKVKGCYDKKGRHMSFPHTDCEIRTDSSFRNKDDPEHHQKASPLERLPIDMIKDFVVADSLHLIDIGLTKKCLNGWVNGSYNFKEKFFIPQVKIVKEWLQRTNSMVPRDIHRAIRGLDYLSFWKATEYRTFLLYLGPVILLEFLSKQAYNHFMLLFCSVTILSSRFYTSKPGFLKIAQNMLIDYIEQFTTLYGEDAISSNVHNLC